MNLAPPYRPKELQSAVDNSIKFFNLKKYQNQNLLLHTLYFYPRTPTGNCKLKLL